jgi:hypothetical protein
MATATSTSFEFTQEGFLALVAKVNELESKLRKQVSSGTVSPPPGRNTAQERTRTYSSESNSSSGISSLEEFTGNTSGLTQMPSKPKYGEIMCTAFLDGWLIHGNTYDNKDMIKANGGKWFGKCKGWALNNKTAVGRILKNINVKKSLEKIENSFENMGLRFYKPVEKKEPPQPLSDEEQQEENAALDNFLTTDDNSTSSKKDVKKQGSATKPSTCLIEESDDDENYNDADDSLDISDGEEE